MNEDECGVIDVEVAGHQEYDLVPIGASGEGDVCRACATIKLYAIFILIRCSPYLPIPLICTKQLALSLPYSLLVSAMELPVLDLSHFTSGTEVQQANFVQLLVSSLAESGFFKLIDHGFSKAAVQELFQRVDLSRSFVRKVTGELIRS